MKSNIVDLDLDKLGQDYSYRFESLTVNTKMITVTHMVSEFVEDMVYDKERYEKNIKKDLALEIANLILKDNLVLITKQYDGATSTITFRARVFLANKDAVSFLVKSGIK